jgi:hypothetical protein
MDIATPAGCFESTFGPAPNDASVPERQKFGGTASFRIPYRRMVDALAQITAIPDQTASGKRRATSLPQRPKVRKKKAETKNKNPHENIVMDEVLREA